MVGCFPMLLIAKPDRIVSKHKIFGDPDDLKFRSCMTLFANTAGDSAIFKDAMQKFFAGKPDRLTLDRIWPRQ
jgi:uncharacterized protein (DUF1810 family)